MNLKNTIPSSRYDWDKLNMKNFYKYVKYYEQNILIFLHTTNEIIEGIDLNVY